MMKKAIMLLIAALLAAPAFAAPPEIAHIHPDYVGTHLKADVPHLLTGEGFCPEQTTLWIWGHPYDAAAIDKAAERLARGEALPPLPDAPPKDARRINPLDVDGQIMMANLWSLAKGNLTVVWAQTPEGFSKPCLFNVAKPVWLNRREARPGSVLSIFGYGVNLKQYHRSVSQRVALVRPGAGPVFAEISRNARGMTAEDQKMLYFRLPTDLPPGDYKVSMHNGFGGEHGWREVAPLKVLSAAKEEVVFNVRDFGARGDGLQNDYSAITAAIQAAVGSGGGVVYLPAGSYAVDTSLRLPSGVILRGENRRVSRIVGFGYDPNTEGRKVWYSSSPQPASVILLGSRTGLERLSVGGSLSKGAGGTGLVQVLPAPDDHAFPDGGEVSDVHVMECELETPGVDAQSGAALYRGSIASSVTLVRMRVENNDLHGGGIDLEMVRRSDFIDNHIRGGGFKARPIDCLVEGNIFSDDPGRFYFYSPTRGTYARFNEIRGRFLDSWQNQPELFLLHGSRSRIVSSPTGAGEASLSDSRQKWQNGKMRDQVVLITAGRGFGQYRLVVDNTADNLILDRPWRVIPDKSSEYSLGYVFSDSAFYANLSDSPGVAVTLWLDCINILVEKHRADRAGFNVWGRSRSEVQEDKSIQGYGTYNPSFYNIFVNNWMDGTDMEFYCRSGANPAERGPILFGTFFLSNRLKSSHLRRDPAYYKDASSPGAIQVGGSSSHTVLADNHIDFTETGINISEQARKTFLLGNRFHAVQRPVTDRGSLTVEMGNRILEKPEDLMMMDIPRAEENRRRQEAYTAMPDRRSQRDEVTARPTPPLQGVLLPPVTEAGGAFADVAATKGGTPMQAFVAGLVYDRRVLQSEEALRQDQENLKQLYRLLRDYEKKNGILPPAAFYPRRPRQDADSLQVILGEAARPFLRGPAAGPDMDEFGWPGYIWNSTVSAKKLADIAEPKKTWLLMNFVAPHPWMVAQGHAGHRGGVNVLLADGTVRWVKPFQWADWAQGNAPSQQ